MINNSYYWKKELYLCYTNIIKNRFIEGRGVDEHPLYQIEKSLLFGAYIIRKLNESNKIPVALLSNRVDIETSKSIVDTIDVLNIHKIDELYDWGNSIKETRNWEFVINQIIHSYAIAYSSDERELFNGIYVNSDYTKNFSIYFIPISLIFELFLSVSELEINTFDGERKVIGKNEMGKPIYDEYNLINISHDYPFGFEINEIIKNNMCGKYYYRKV